MALVVARYREFQPCAELRPHVRAIFTFASPPGDDGAVSPDSGRTLVKEIVRREGDPYWSTLFADGHVSLVSHSGSGCRIDGIWEPREGGPRMYVIGGMSRAHRTSAGQHVVQVGAYFRAGRANSFFAAPSCEFTDKAVALGGVWKSGTAELEDKLGSAGSDGERVNILEGALLRCVARSCDAPTALDIAGLAAMARRQPARATVQSMADFAGVSRQHLTRRFREQAGVSPKLYCRLSRFRHALALAGARNPADWASLALAAGYADQAHMIAEFREFGGMTPVTLNTGRRVQPFAAQPLEFV